MTETPYVMCKQGRSSLVRPRFGAGMLLQHDDLEALGDSSQALSRLLFRSFFGCGVVCGLKVTPPEGNTLQITVNAGVALDCLGDPIEVTRVEVLHLDDCKKDVTGPLWVVLCGKTKCCAPRSSGCAGEDTGASCVSTRQWSWYEIRVVGEEPHCACGRQAPATSTATPGNDPVENDWYESGDCPTCHCDDECADCDCHCVLLAKVVQNKDKTWTADHSVRRFVRPARMVDPQLPKPPADAAMKAQAKAAAEAIDATGKAKDAADQAGTSAGNAEKAVENAVYAAANATTAAGDDTHPENAKEQFKVAAKQAIEAANQVIAAAEITEKAANQVKDAAGKALSAAELTTKPELVTEAKQQVQLATEQVTAAGQAKAAATAAKTAAQTVIDTAGGDPTPAAIKVALGDLKPQEDALKQAATKAHTAAGEASKAAGAAMGVAQKVKPLGPTQPTP